MPEKNFTENFIKKVRSYSKHHVRGWLEPEKILEAKKYVEEHTDQTFEAVSAEYLETSEVVDGLPEDKVLQHKTTDRTNESGFSLIFFKYDDIPEESNLREICPENGVLFIDLHYWSDFRPGYIA